MKRNTSFVFVIFIVLISEISFHEYNHQDSLWTISFRTFSWILMALWHYETQKKDFNRIQKAFLISILLPIIILISSFVIPEKQAIIINICTNMAILMLWIYAFKHLGASISLNDSNQTLPKLTPAFFILPLLFYYFALYQSLPTLYAVFVLIYILIFSYTGVLSAFLPINEEKRLWIVFGIMLIAMANIMNGHHTFLQKLPWAYPVIRTMTVVSRCMMIYGMISFLNSKPIVLADEN